MATKNTTKAAVESTETAELTPLQIVNEGIMRVIEAHDINVQKNRYKAMRAIAWQAFVESIAAGEFDALVERASANVDELPSGWELEAASKPAPKAAPKPVANQPAPKPAHAKAPVKKSTTTKAPAKAATPRRRTATTKAAQA
jgi:hypothetical protein